MGSKSIEIAALGRPLYPGMLYDCRDDSFIPGVTLWDSKALENNLNVHQKPNSDFTLSTSDSFKEKSNLLDVSASLKVSFLGGLIEVGGSAKYLKNDVSSTRQCRVTMKYSKTVRFEQLTMSQLGNITYPQVFEQQTATHVVTAVLYGAQAFVVFDQIASADENKQEIEGKLHVMVKKIPELSIEGEGAVKLTEDEKKTAQQFSCMFHGDFDLKHSPTTYQEAIEVYKTLSGLLGEKGEKAVPLRVWLYPLKNLDPKAARLVREIRVDLVSQVEEALDLLREVSMRARDMTGNSLLNGFPDLKDRLSEFQHKTLQYKIGVFEKAVSRVLPAIRGGREEEEEEGEAALAVILKIHNASPFSSREMHRWLDEKECEMKVLKLYTAALKDVPLMKSTVELDGVLFDPEIETVVCFAFTKLQDNEEYLLTLTQCLESEEFRKLEKDVHSDLRVYTVEPQPWFTSPEHSDTMRRNLELFRWLSEINKHQKKTRFIVASISDYSRPGASICLYSRGVIVDSQFKCLSKPLPPMPTDIQPDSVTLKLLPPEVGECERYRVEHRAVQRAAETGTEPGQEEWTATDTPDTQESWTLSGLQPGMLYQVRYRGVRALLASEASEAVEVHTKLGSGSAPGQPSVHRAGAYGAWVSWKKPAGAVEGGLSVAQYRVEYKDAMHALWSSQLTDGDVTTCTVEGLKLARSYTFRVYSVFTEGALSTASPETKLLSEAEYVPDLNKRPYQTTLMCVGGPGGDPFSFYGLNNGVTLKTIRVHFNVYWIRCIQVELSSGLKATFGGSTMPFKKVFEFHFDFCPGERFSALAIYDTWAPPYGTMLGGIRFTTTQGRHFHAKSNNMASCEEYSVDVGSGVCLGVEGRHGWEVDCLGFVFIK